MADRGDTHYHVPKLNLWFALSSVILLASSVWMVIDDWSRSWKDYQRAFFKLEVDRSHAALETPDSQTALKTEAELEAELEKAKADLQQRHADVAAQEEELLQLKGRQFKATEAEKSAKQEYNWARFQFEEGHTDKADLDAKEAILQGASKEKEAIDTAVLAQEAKVKGLYADRDNIEKRMKGATKDVDLVRKKLAKLDPKDKATWLAEKVRDFPGLDFIGPNLKVKKVVLDDLTFELNFTRKPRIDMCQTCHMAIDQEGYDGDQVKQPFKSHPRLDLFLTAKSPHPLADIGCTICHRGGGESLEFVRADHRPSDEQETKAWEDEYGWHKQHHWDYPMLSSEYVEASCVQCHKDSMELIAGDAPKLTEGYQLFERFGCYACHKVDWFPTKRRPGPSLKGIAQKTTPEFVASWIANPRGFRPSTWMPQFFHLENWPEDDTVVVSQYGQGREIKGREWNDTAVAAITAFVLDRARQEPAPEVPLEGDPARGKELFRVSGCLACHSMTPFPGRTPEDETDLALQPRHTNEQGPNLRGVATKITPGWLFQWIKEPSAYWSETRMPDLNLPDQDIADIVAYVFDSSEPFFQDVPDGWQEQGATFVEDVLQEQARWYFANRTRADFDHSFQNEWKDPQNLLVAVGEKLVLAHGCHSCHEIAGLENQMPIGTELTTWGSKTVDKLDFGFIPELFGEERGWSHHEVEEFKNYREGWVEQKLHEPRSYDRALTGGGVRVKNPVERLKMPWFDFDEHEVKAIAGFVVGLVKDEVQHAHMVPTAGQARMDAGLRAVRQKNCAACHVIEPGTITYNDEDGARRTVSGQVLPLSDEESMAPPLGPGFHPFLEGYEKYTEEDLEEVIVELLRPEPGIGLVGDTVVVEGAENVDAIETTPAWGGDFVPLVVDYYRHAEQVEDVDGESRDYSGENYVKVRWTFAPPFLVDEGYKVQRDWFYQFLLDPYPLRKQIRVKMPRFNWAEGEAGAVADYFSQQAARDDPVRYVRRALAQNGLFPEDAAAQAAAAGAAGVTAGVLQGIAAGNQASIDASFPKVAGWAGSEKGLGFAIAGPVDPSYEPVVPRTPSSVQRVLETHPDFWAQMRRLTGAEGPNCFQCHWLNGNPPNASGPLAWAPDLQYTRDRLRPDWVREWLTNPSRIYPGTAMPANFEGQQWQEILPGPPDQQIEAVIAWLFNLDREPTR